MASPSRPFQSQVMTRAVRLYHRVAATGTRWLRVCQSTALLWTQVALYPAYVALQATRVALRKAQAITARWRDRGRLNSSPSGRLGSQRQLTSDWGLQQVLAAISPSKPGTSQKLAPEADTHAALWRVDYRALQVNPQQFPAGMQIRGLASCLENCALVVVSPDNQIVDGLLAEQQAAIADFIVQLMAAYTYWQRRQQRLRRLQAGPLPLPIVSSRAWWPVRVVMWLMAWIQTGTVAKTMNLFQEAESSYCLPAPSWPLLSSYSLSRIRQLRPQVLTQCLEWLKSHFSHRWWVQQCLQAFKDIQVRLVSRDASFSFNLPIADSPPKLLSAQRLPDIGPFRSGYWRGSHQPYGGKLCCPGCRFRPDDWLWGSQR